MRAGLELPLSLAARFAFEPAQEAFSIGKDQGEELKRYADAPPQDRKYRPGEGGREGIQHDEHRADHEERDEVSNERAPLTGAQRAESLALASFLQHLRGCPLDRFRSEPDLATERHELLMAEMILALTFERSRDDRVNLLPGVLLLAHRARRLRQR